MKRACTLMLTCVALMTPSITHAQVAGSTVIGVSAAELREVANGWSVKHQVLGQPVFNDQNERVGTVDDVIIAPDKSVSYAIINAGGFLGLAKHDVAVPVSKIKLDQKKLVLAGATKEALRQSAPFEYSAPVKNRRHNQRSTSVLPGPLARDLTFQLVAPSIRATACWSGERSPVFGRFARMWGAKGEADA